MIGKVKRMTTFNYKDFYEKVGKENGWDFSKIQYEIEGMQWDFTEEVIKRCSSSDLLLDIGTGGGEKALQIASFINFLVGIDVSNGMIKTAKANMAKAKVSNARFVHMDANQLQFPAMFFDIVSCRHSPFNAKEVANVLTEDGLFITQQVSEHDKLNIMQAFGRGSLDKRDGELKERYETELKQAGFSTVNTYEYDAIEYYQRTEDLIFLLKHTPIIPNFGEAHADFEILEQFILENKTDKGIITNSKRFMIVAKK